MTKGISGAHFNPGNLWRRANITRYAHLGESIGAMEISVSFGDAQTAITPSSVAIDMKNTINIDKYMKRFMAKTIKSFHLDSEDYRHILK